MKNWVAAAVNLSPPPTALLVSKGGGINSSRTLFPPSFAKPTERFVRFHPDMATGATLKASRILQTASAAQRTSAMRWIHS